MAAVLALPATYTPRIAGAVSAAPRLPVVWLRGQDCAGDTMAFLRAADPTVGQLMLELLSVEYHETLMAPAGLDATEARLAAMEEFADGYVAVIEGSIPTADDGALTAPIGGRSFRDVAREVCDGALATIAVGSCACDGGAPAAGGGPTGAVGAADAVAGGTLIRLPGCPINVEYLTATLVHYLTFGAWPATDGMQRPLLRLRVAHPQPVRATPSLRVRRVRPGLGRRGGPEGLVPLQDGLQGSRDVRRMPDDPVRRAAPAGRSARATAASAATRRASGTR